MNLSNIQQRGNTLLVDVTKHGKRHRVACSTMDEALAVKAKILNLVPDYVVAKAPEGWTLRQAYNEVLAHKWKGTPNESNSVRHAEEFMQHMNANSLLDDVSTERVDQFILKLKDSGNSGATINRKLAAASALFTFAHPRGKCKTRPHFERQKEGEGRTSYITDEIEERILNYLTQWGYVDHVEAITCLVDTGLRPSELWRLTGRNINLGIGTNGILIVERSKNGKKRAVPLTVRVKAIITRRMEATVSGPLFPFDKNWLERVWARVRTQMGMDSDKEFVPYILRHTCASRLIQKKVDLTLVQEWLGHKSILVTRKYSHHAPENLMNAVAVLER